MKKRGDRPGDLRRQVNRIRRSRDNLKDINREKAAMNKILGDRNAELAESRDQWKVRSKELNRQLQAARMEMPSMEIHEKSDAESVCKALEKAQKKVGKAAMVCADDGPDLRRGIVLFCKKHNVGRIFDITHKIGTFLKKLLENDPEWQAFTSAAAEAKRKMQQTQAVHLAPPNQRTKSRFLNWD